MERSTTNRILFSWADKPSELFLTVFLMNSNSYRYLRVHQKHLLSVDHCERYFALGVVNQTKCNKKAKRKECTVHHFGTMSVIHHIKPWWHVETNMLILENWENPFKGIGHCGMPSVSTHLTILIPIGSKSLIGIQLLFAEWKFQAKSYLVSVVGQSKWSTSSSGPSSSHHTGNGLPHLPDEIWATERSVHLEAVMKFPSLRDCCHLGTNDGDFHVNLVLKLASDCQ